jgi:hypothetical protein
MLANLLPTDARGWKKEPEQQNDDVKDFLVNV